VQTSLFEEPPHARHRDPPSAIPPADPHVEHVDKPALAAQTAAVLERLRQGPASVPQLEAASGSQRVAARVYDLKKAGYHVARYVHDREQRVYGYKLLETTEEPDTT
jgi:hypothetical protein